MIININVVITIDYRVTNCLRCEEHEVTTKIAGNISIF